MLGNEVRLSYFKSHSRPHLRCFLYKYCQLCKVTAEARGPASCWWKTLLQIVVSDHNPAV